MLKYYVYIIIIVFTRSPMGFYFVSGSHDRSARIWSTDHIQPVRILAGHLSDVDVSWEKKQSLFVVPII